MMHVSQRPLLRENIAGSFLMVLSMAAFAGEDSVIKALSEWLPVSQVIFMIGIGGSIIFASSGLFLKKEIFQPEINSKPMHARIITEIFGRIFYSLALALTPLSTTTMILQATPLIVVAGAAIFFKERVSAKRWLAIALGFFGVMVIIWPDQNEFTLLSVLAVLGMLGFAMRDLASRAAPSELNIFTLGWHGFLSLALAGLILSFLLQQSFKPLPSETWLFLGAGIFFGVIGYSALISAMRIGEVSAITPFRYTRLIFGLSIGHFVFNEKVATSSLLGCFLIVLSSLAVMYSKKARHS